MITRNYQGASMTGPTAKPQVALRAGTALRKGVVVGFIQDALDPMQEILVCNFAKEVVDLDPLLLPQLQDLLSGVAVRMMAQMGYSSEVVQRQRAEGQQVGQVTPPSETSTIILDPIEEARRRKS